MSDLEAIEERVQAIYQRVASAIVRINSGTNVSHSGVIITSAGHVISRAAANPGQQITIRLADGREVEGTTLGWSSEWRIGLSKIVDEGPWPHVEMGTTSALKSGQRCIALGYPRRGDGQYDDVPALRLGNVTRVDAPFWLTTSCAVVAFESGRAVVDLDGRLIGLTSRIDAYGGVETAVDVASVHWNDLAAGKNLDWVRYPPAKDSAFHQLGAPMDLDRLGIRPADEVMQERPKSEDDDLLNGSNSRVTDSIEKATAATVRIRSKERRSGDGRIDRWSGVVVSRDGYVLTCGHTKQLPGEKVTVCFPDGRDAPAVVLGTNWVSDVGLIKITEGGPWPHAEMGTSASMWPGDSAFIIGYPAQNDDRQPLVQTAEIAKTPYVIWDPLIFTTLKHQIWGGTSGGGIFDAQGRLVAVHLGGGNTRIEVARKQWDYLAAGKPVDITSSARLAPLSEAFEAAAAQSQSAVVAVLADDEQVALGTIVASDGWILSKASELDGKLTCRLADGRILPARIERTARQHDLALLKVDARGLVPANFVVASEELARGELLAALVPGERPRVDVVSIAARAIPAQPVWSGDGLRDTGDGLEVQSLPRLRGLNVPLREGDIIVDVEGHQTPDREDFQNVMGLHFSPPHAFSGDPVTMQVRRSGELIELRFPLLPIPPQPSVDRYSSPRCCGFPEVFDTGIPLLRKECGGPLIDRTGRVAGITIASRASYRDVRGPTHAVSGATAWKAARDLIDQIER